MGVSTSRRPVVVVVVVVAVADVVVVAVFPGHNISPREVERFFTAVGPHAVSLAQTIVSTGNIVQINASVMVKVR